MTWLVTGGAGYIGAHVVRAMADAGIATVVVDDLSSGHRERVPHSVPLLVGSVAEVGFITWALRAHRITGVVHCAGKKHVSESVGDPLLYYRENVGGCESLLHAMADAGVARCVFSSSAAVYGVPAAEYVNEDAATEPTNPYGYTKLVCERMLRHAGTATGLAWIALRYFNVAGAADPGLADISPTNLIPMTFDALTAGRRPQIFGDDYPTSDGTCIRDFIHVADLADAHVTAARAMSKGCPQATYNVGRGSGASVREVMTRVGEVTGLPVVPEIVGRRRGDPDRVIADPGRIAAELGWRARRGLGEMIESAWTGWLARGARCGAVMTG